MTFHDKGPGDGTSLGAFNNTRFGSTSGGETKPPSDGSQGAPRAGGGDNSAPGNAPPPCTDAVRSDAEIAVPENASAQGAPARVDETLEAYLHEFSDEMLALNFAARNQDCLRYVASLGEWYVWDGRKWTEDLTLLAFNLARAECREACVYCHDTATRKSIASAKTVAAVERLAKSDRLLAAKVDQWDSDPWALNTPGGIVDLRTGTVWPHRPEDYQTKITAVAPGGDCPKWLAFLDRITDHDVELQSFLARLFGYCATGVTKEHAMFFCYGTGANGKSVLLNTVAGVLNDYSKTSPVETFTASHNDRHSTELARLVGARLVTVSETDEGRNWDEPKIKKVTGGDTIAARFLYKDHFEYVPQFKLVIAGNHKPALRSVDEAIRRRLNLIPFTVTIPPEERDPDLEALLKLEWRGILQWMIDGCLQWQKIGLAPPKCVTDATAAYLEAEDTALTWINECCLLGAEHEERSLELYTSYKGFADKTGERPHTHKAFGTMLAARGFETTKRRRGTVYSGICVKPSMLGDER